MTRRKAVIIPAVLLSLGALAGVAVATPAMGTTTGNTAETLPASTPTPPSTSSVVEAIERSAHTLRGTDPEGSLRDLDALGRMVRGAEVVGLGEATHGSRDFFRMKHRVFRYLVEEKGFRSFSLELPWSSGIRINDYVLRGKGDLKDIARDEFQGAYRIWNNQDYLDLIEWMRDYNRQHPKDPVQFMGDDMGYAGPELYERVNSYVARDQPRLRARVAELYRGLPPTTDAATYYDQYLQLPLAERKERAERTGKVYELLRKQGPGAGADRQRHLWAVQHARAIHQMAEGFAFDITDETQVAAMMRYRDQVMAENVAWWHRHTGDRVLLSAHNTHVSYDSFDERYPKTQGAFLRDALGKDYVSVGFSFYEGSFKAFGADDNVMRTYSVGAAKPGSNEETLDKARQEDYILDMRTAPNSARAWLNTSHATWNIGAGWPDPTEYKAAPAKAHDILIHLHDVEATTYLGAP
ncbi:erythromycin esterase-like protein [Streptomyces aurantiacus]|uniref:erythromycin esterase family protein n=1 Tax=Streptomyces aurantiacus TaxID=47760 RepID=UPI0027909420|nr:erythromycin esterase family protein [Streptomyces aurantiacus]MDQ0774969.1 erythromycin esterase-like protein [Streptomyces aurantiacus]